MRSLYLIIITLFYSTAIIGQHKEIVGNVTDSKTLAAIPFAHLYNVILKTGTHTDESGNFTLIVRVGDSIRISAIGFKTQFYRIQANDYNSFLHLRMDGQTVELDAVQIFAYKDIESFKRAIIESDVKPEPKLTIYGLPTAGSDYGKLAILPRVKAPTAEKLVATVGPTFASVPLAVKDKERILFERKKAVASKYNSVWIKEVTGLDESEIDEFIRFCRLEEDYIFDASEYDLTVAVLTCLYEFKSKHH